MTKYEELAARVEAATGGDRMLNFRIDVLVNDRPDRVPSNTELAHDIYTPRFTDSIDAALSLVPKGWFPLLDWTDAPEGNYYAELFGPGDTPLIRSRAKAMTLALCAAALRSLSVQVPANVKEERS